MGRGTTLNIALSRRVTGKEERDLKKLIKKVAGVEGAAFRGTTLTVTVMYLDIGARSSLGHEFSRSSVSRDVGEVLDKYAKGLRR